MFTQRKYIYFYVAGPGLYTEIYADVDVHVQALNN